MMRYQTFWKHFLWEKFPESANKPSAPEKLGVRTAGDVSRFPEEFWLKRLGKFGKILHDRAKGEDPRPVEPYIEAKSESAENTFSQDTADRETLSVWLMRQAERVGTSLRAQNSKGRTITLKINMRILHRKRGVKLLHTPQTAPG